MSNNFKLLAIRPLKDCDKIFLKNLKAGEIYKLYNDFEYCLDKDDIISIKNNFTIPENLFGEKISVSAIVGKNGSGKSSLIDIFNSLIFNFSVKLNLINIESFKKEHSLNNFDKKKVDNEIINFEKLNCEIIYLIDDTIFSLSKKKQIIYFQKFELIDSQNYSKKSTDSINLSYSIPHEEKVRFLYNSFFYTIGANYSLYGLNTSETGIWLKSIFHKNDGYQTPIVLNPMRTDGIIDINRLTYLSKSRLVSNVFKKLEKDQEVENSLRNIVNNKIINKLILNLDLNKFEIIDPENIKKNQNIFNIINVEGKTIYLKYTDSLKKKYLELILEAFYPSLTFGDLIVGDDILKKLTIEYILRKTETIVKKYPEYQIYSKTVFRANAKIETIKYCFGELATDFSHITFKLRQAINFLIFDFYKLKNQTKSDFLITNNDTDIVNSLNIKLEKLKQLELKKLDESYKNQPDLIDLTEAAGYIYNKYSLINFLPPSFFEVDLEFKGKGHFKDLSSGEKQLVYSLSSIVYHLNNLNSIKNDERISYNKFNIVLDEIELYFHPDFQRKFLSELLKSINNLGVNDIAINILFLTHSPFILSDIPSQNILKLDDGCIMPVDVSENTFGANIHDLLAKDFFLKDGLIGEFSKNIIENIILKLNLLELIKNIKLLKNDENFTEIEKEKIYLEEIQNLKLNTEFEKFTNEEIEIKINKENKNIEKIIKLIGEPVYKYKLKSMYENVFISNQKELKIAEIKRLLEDNGLTKDDLNL